MTANDVIGASNGSAARQRPIHASARLVDDQAGTIAFETSLHRAQLVTATTDVLSPDNPTLDECIGERRALVVMSPSVHRLCGDRVRRYFESRPDHLAVEFMVLKRAEATKAVDGALEVSDRASAAGLNRTAPIVAIGGGVCSDTCGLAAAVHRRGVPHLNVPTTLVGLIDAGIGAKNAVNHRGRKSALGSFHPPEHVILDPTFLASVPRRHLCNGLAEMIKLAIVRDGVLFSLLEDHVHTVLRTSFQEPAPIVASLVQRSVRGMLEELAANPFEIHDYRRKVDFGHTFSPYWEIRSGHDVLHGEAVAMDIALSSSVAVLAGLLSGSDYSRIVSLLRAAGLAVAWEATSLGDLWRTLTGVVEQRNGDLHLVVPTGVGSCAFLELDDLSPSLLHDAFRRVLVDARAARRPAATAFASVPTGALP